MGSPEPQAMEEIGRREKAQEWAARRRDLAERWTRHEPMTPVEMAGAAYRDAEAGNVLDTRDYDRRGLLNVVGALLDEAEAAAPSPVTGEAELRARFRSRLAADPGLADTGRILARFDEAVCDGSCGPEHSTTHLFDHPSPSKQDSVPEPVTGDEWPDLANDIRIVDGNHDLGAGALAGALTARGWTKRPGGAEGPIDGWAKCSKCPWSVTGASSMMEAAGWLKEHQVSHGSPAPQAPAGSLDAAWAAAEALGTSGVAIERMPAPKPDARYCASEMDDDSEATGAHAYGPTPAAALRALAARLDSQGSAQGREK